MAVLYGSEAQQIIGVGYASTWTGVSEMLADMQAPKRGPTNARVSMSDIERFKRVNRDPIAGAYCREKAASLMGNVPEMLKEERRPIRVWADDGGELSIERYLNDEEDYWRRIKRPKRPARTIRLMAEISSTGWTTDEELKLRCSTIVALGQWLTESGYEVEILAADYSRNFGIDGCTELGTVVVKEASQDLDVDNLAAVLCSQNFGYDILLRAIVHTCPIEVKYHWGHVISIPDNVLKALQVDVSVPRRIMDEYEAARWLKAQVARLSTKKEDA